MKALQMSLVMIGIIMSQATIAQSGGLLAWYPLNGTPNDSTGHFGPMILDNTPFQPGGGIYCNGIYRNAGLPDSCDANTPIFPISIFQSFTVTLKFKVDTIRYEPIIVGGFGWRWIGLQLYADTTVALMFNGGNYQPSSNRISVNRWYEAAITYDSAHATGNLYLDGVPACSANFTIIHGPEYDRSFGVTNYGSGKTFKGYLKDLKIYSSSTFPTHVDQPPAHEPEGIRILESYPNPVRESATVSITLSAASHVTVKVFNIFGLCIATVFDDNLSAGAHTIRWKTQQYLPGVYYYRLMTGNRSSTNRFIVTK